MGITREDLKRTGRDLELTDEQWEVEKAERQRVLDNYMANEKWTCKLLKKVGVLLTSHPGNRPFLKPSLESHQKLGYWVCVAYDNYYDPDNPTITSNDVMPDKDTIDLINTFIMPNHQTWGGVLFPYIFLLRFGALAMSHFEYIYCTNGDFILEKPENFDKLFDLMGDADIMTCGHDEPKRYANTAGFIVKSEALLGITKHMVDHMIPFEVYEKHTQEIGNAEGRFGRAIYDLGLKQKIVDPPIDDMLKIPGKGTWYDLVGFRHIHAELNNAYRRKGIPPPLKYMDRRYLSGHDIEWLTKYEKTNDAKILESWWAKE